MDLTQLYNDPATQMLAQRFGLSVQDYVGQLDPRAVSQNLSRLSQGPALYTNPDQYSNMLATGANSPLAYIPEQGNPVTEGMLFNPTMGQPPQADGPPQVPTAMSGGPTQREAPMLAQPPVMGQPPAAPQEAPILASSGMGASQGALSNSGAGAAVVSRPNAGPSSGSRQTPTNNTANARNSGMPDMRIGRSEGLGRIGTAMLAGNKTGLMDAMAAGGNAMYATSDANRQAELAEYENSERLRLEKVKEAQVAAALAARGRGGSGGSGRASSYGSVGAQAAQFNEIIAALRSDGNLTGPIAGTVGQARDRSGVFGGDAARADLRLQMEGIALNEQLLYTAETKGAITDREMAMFRKPIPKITDSEELWIAWLTPRADVLNQLAQNGISNAAAAASGGGGSTPAPTAFNPSDYTIEEIDQP